MVTGELLLICIGTALAWFIGMQTLAGVKWLGREVKKGGAAIVHVLHKIPHPQHHNKESER